jgi:hypothetical protein
MISALDNARRRLMQVQQSLLLLCKVHFTSNTYCRQSNERELIGLEEALDISRMSIIDLT